MVRYLKVVRFLEAKRVDDNELMLVFFNLVAETSLKSECGFMFYSDVRFF